MVCESWRDKVEAYADGELSSADANGFAAHLRQCAGCAAAALEQVQAKRAIRAAGERYRPDAEFRARVLRSVRPRPRMRSWPWTLAVSAACVCILILSVSLSLNWERVRRERVYGELTDLHVATLASANPVDVISTDRHTVKPWFEGRIPFTFNLPDLDHTDYSLVGGRVTYLGQSPGAQLIYRIRKHEISVFIFQDRGNEIPKLPLGTIPAFSFHIESWTDRGLRYFVVGDVGQTDLEALSQLLRQPV